jgi:hypothetical protein
LKLVPFSLRSSDDRATTAEKLGESGDVDRLAVRPYTVKVGSCQEKVVAERAVIGPFPRD